MGEFDEKAKIWFDGKMVNWQDAKIHVMSHVIHYGSSVFEGIRCYHTKTQGSAIFRLRDHIQRLFNSAKIYRMEIPLTLEECMQACIDVIRVNHLQEAYIRPIVFRGYGALGVLAKGVPLNMAVGAWHWGKYLGDTAISEGVDVRVSSWNRLPSNTMPCVAKAGSNYMNSQLIRMEANLDGYAEGIALNQQGYVSEGSGENLFMVYEGQILTPPLAASILPGITRSSVMVLAREMDYEVVEQMIPRSLLYLAEELFFTGTAAEISPIRSVDRITIGNGKRGPITKKLQDRFFGIISGDYEDRYHWLTPVN